EAIALHCGLDSLRAAEIRSGVFGQPLVRGDGLAGVAVSLSHTRSLAVALAFDDAHPMGIDLEEIGRGFQEEMESQLSSREKEIARAAPFGREIALAML